MHNPKRVARLLPGEGCFPRSVNSDCGERTVLVVRLVAMSVVLACVLIAVVVWCTVGDAPQEPLKSNVVLISMDTCRADRLSCYGYSRGTTPHIDALAREGVLFSNVISPAPSTLPAHCSMLTGTNPPTHGVHGNHDYRLPDSNVTLAEVLRDHGYVTAAFLGAFVLHNQFGLAQGFDTYDDYMDSDAGGPNVRSERRADAVSDPAEAWLEEHAEDRFFLFLHYYDPHAPYSPPEPYASEFSGDSYAGEIAYVDSQVGRIVDKLESLGLYDSTTIVVTADHGEGLGEHGEAWHDFFIYHSTTKVPLIIRQPNAEQGRRVDETVALIDIMPTILRRVGAPVPPRVQGVDLSAYLAGGAPEAPKRYVYSESLTPTMFECGALFGLETREYKYIQTVRPELYDLVNDPGETVNIVQEHPDLAHQFRGRLEAVLQSQVAARGDEARVSLDRRSVERLEGLGYVGGAMLDQLDLDMEGEDPKDFVGVYGRIKAAASLLSQGKREAVVRVCKQMLDERPDAVKAHEFLGIVASLERNWARKEYHYSEVLRIDPTSAEAHFALGNAVGRQQRLDEAIYHFREAVRLAGETTKEEELGVGRALRRASRVNPVVFQARLHLADTLMVAGRPEEAIEGYDEALQSDILPSAPGPFKHVVSMAYCRLASLLRDQRQFDRAIEAYRHALELEPDCCDEARRGLEAVMGIVGRSKGT